MNTLRRLTVHTLALSCVALAGCGNQENLLEPDGGGGAVPIAALSYPFAAQIGGLTDGERAHLIFMRSEEKLARDVYLTLDGMYPERPVFSQIATTAEQTHTDTMLEMLLKFGVVDPEPSTLPGTLPPPEDIGEFENPYFAEYFSDKFVALTDKAKDPLEALKVGALIEELDMKDINYCNGIIYDVFQFPTPPPDYCGLTVTDLRPLENTLGNLLAGSENHLCAFISQIGPMIGPECYDAQYLEQQEVWDIINAQCPEFVDYVCTP